MNARDVAAILCGGLPEDAAVIGRWIQESRSFHAFADQNRAKIRKKLRTAGTAESLRSVILELEVARHFVVDRRCVVEYERYGQGGIRGPDLTVTFRARTVVNLEVTLLQGSGADWEGRLTGLVCQKLGQMIPETPNVLVLAADAGALTIDHVTETMRRLKVRMEGREAELLKRFGFDGPAGFFKQFQWLSGIVVWRGEAESGAGKSVWLNRQARRPLTPAFISILTV